MTMGCCQTQLVTGANVRDVTGLNVGVEDRKLKPFIELAQYQLEKILGTTLYDELETAVIADRTLTGETALIALFEPYICPFLSWRALELAYPRLYAEADRGGVFTKSGDEFASASRNDLASLTNQAKAAADMHQDRLIDFLQDNTSTYTTYNTSVDGEERIRKVYRAGIALTRSRWQNPHGRPTRTRGERDCDCDNVNDALY